MHWVRISEGCRATNKTFLQQLEIGSAHIFVTVGFLYPAFLIAGLTLAVPLLIHLFNLRRYKTVFFPHTRFLRNIQLRSRRSSEVRYKWLLGLRLVFLAI